MRPEKVKCKTYNQTEALYNKSFKTNYMKIGYLICNFGTESQYISRSMMIGGVQVPKHEAFWYLRSIIQRNNEIKKMQII